MTAEQEHIRAACFQCLCDEQSEFSIAQDGNALAFRDFDLIENFTSGGDGFNEDGVSIGNRFWDDVKIRDRQGEEFLKRAGMIDDAQDFARGAMTAEAATAPIAGSAGEIDFTGDSRVEPGRIIGAHYFANEFVTGRAAKVVISAL